MDCIRATKEYNRRFDDRYDMILMGIGIATGTVIYDPSLVLKIYGPAMEQSFHLGEDISKAGQVIMTEQTVHACGQGLSKFSLNPSVGACSYIQV